MSSPFSRFNFVVNLGTDNLYRFSAPSSHGPSKKLDSAYLKWHLEILNASSPLDEHALHLKRRSQTRKVVSTKCLGAI